MLRGINMVVLTGNTSNEQTTECGGLQEVEIRQSR